MKKVVYKRKVRTSAKGCKGCRVQNGLNNKFFTGS